MLLFSDRTLHLILGSALAFGAITQAPAQQLLAPPPEATQTTSGETNNAETTSTTAPEVRELPLHLRLDLIFDEPQWSNAMWGVMVQDLESSAVLYKRNVGKSVMPASNMKLFTTAAALATLGADHKFETKIYATGTTDTAGVLHGNIYIVGSGDPSISGRYLDTPTTAILQQWADAITSAGIKRVNGDIIGDDDIFDDRSIGSWWSEDYLQEWYAAENSGLAINDNCWDVVLEAVPVRSAEGTTMVAKASYPIPTSYFKVDTSDIRVTSGSEDGRGGTYLSIEREDQERGTTIKLSGRLAAGEPEKEWGSLPNGTLFTATLVKEALERNGVGVTGDAVDIDDMDRQLVSHLKANPGQVVHTHLSAPLPKILAIINKPSQNFYADMLLKAVGAHVYGVGNWSNGETVVEDLLTTAGANPHSFSLGDGSGLSRKNLVEPNQVVALLRYMHRRPDFKVFEESLPVMGLDGTLKGRMAGTVAEGNVKAKTGTIGGVRALSGYLTTNSGKKLAFCMIANNFAVPTSAATEAQNRALLELINE